ncbi:LOW QUALITY PROTEIN: uncharacterized protein LOC110093644 [Dendrobium catenatum]|uniref:LOW QUALITY PROTEIN: uncharacterized protein LOC110093644 n=1 Tax=Dendrobium catenatum TaxID=906689 RepID=UPI00109EFDD3|nr:LOW QUALITY PROTEIN: uncharacterized protein LOC110093644 [Dendrobium catenatum]
MPKTLGVHFGTGDLGLKVVPNKVSIKVGTTGTIGALMSQELESMRNSAHTSSFQKKNRSKQVSVSCVHSSIRTDHGNLGKANNKQKSLANGQLAPILSNEANTDKNTRTKRPWKKIHTYIVEAVDIKCNNPMSNRLKKLGFSKLSESIG